MIDVQHETPTVYFNNSRDYQYLGRTLELLLNYIKMNVDIMEGTYRIDNINQTLVPYLLSMLGFEGTHEYTNVDLLILAKVFKLMIKQKGTREALRDIIYVLLRSEHYESNFKVTVPIIDASPLRNITLTPQDLSDLYTVEIVIPTSIKDTTIIEDLLDYVLPTGFTYRIITSDTSVEVTTEVEITVDEPTVTKTLQGSLEINGVYSSEENKGGETYKSIVYGGYNESNE